MSGHEILQKVPEFFCLGAGEKIPSAYGISRGFSGLSIVQRKDGILELVVSAPEMTKKESMAIRRGNIEIRTISEGPFLAGLFRIFSTYGDPMFTLDSFFDPCLYVQSEWKERARARRNANVALIMGVDTATLEIRGIRMTALPEEFHKRFVEFCETATETPHFSALFDVWREEIFQLSLDDLWGRGIPAGVLVSLVARE